MLSAYNFTITANEIEIAEDALLILRIAAKLQTPTEEQRIAGDVDKSGSVDANDALDVLKKAAKLIDVFSAEVN